MSFNTISDKTLQGISGRAGLTGNAQGIQGASDGASAFAAALDSARRSDDVRQAGISAAGGNDSPLQAASSAAGAQALDLYGDHRLARAVQDLSGAAEDRIDLENLTLDFSAMLPEGSREFIRNLKCTDQEMNGFVNLMVFGREHGPHGQNAAGFFGSMSLNRSELSDAMNDLLSSVRINTHGLSGDDFGFVLSRDGERGSSLAQSAGESLEDRFSEQELESVYERDMALMQVLSRSSNQSAGIF